MAFLNNLEELRSVEWSASYLWDVRFTDPTPPAPFSTFFPAQDVEENLTSLESMQFELYHKTVKIPHRSAAKSISITFPDDMDNTLLTWFHEWVEGVIFNENGSIVAVLEEAVRRVDILKMNAQRETIQTTSYWVFPEGPLNFNGTSESKLHQYSFNFVVAGRVGRRPRAAKSDFAFQRIPQSPDTSSRLSDADLDVYGQVQNTQNGTLGRGRLNINNIA